MSAMTVRDVLLGAIDVLAERGWSQGVLEAKNGSVCAVGALRLAATGAIDIHTPVPKSYGAALEALEDRVGVGFIPDWNDGDSTSYEDVVLALKQAAEAAS